MKKHSIFFILVILLLAATANAKMLLYDNCEGSYTTLWRDQGMTGTNLISSSSTHALSGTYSYKIHQTACPTGKESCTGGAQTNTELITIKNTSPNIKNFETDQEYWISWNTFYPSDWPGPAGFGLQGQFHGAEDEACSNHVNVTLFGLYFQSGGTTQTAACKYQDDACAVTAKNCTNFGDYSSPMPVVKNAWNSTVIHFKVNWNGNGFLEVWRNGTQYVDYSGSFGYNDSPKGPNFKLGLYGHFGENVDVWIDEIRMGDQDETYTSMLGGVPSNVAPTVAIDTPSGNQSISLNDSLSFTCTAADSDGSIASYLWDFDDSGIAQSSSEDPDSKQFTQAGIYTVRVTVTDDDGATASDTVNVVVESETITGLINNHLIESGAIVDDDEVNEDLVNHGTITIEGSGTEMNPPGLGTHGTAALDGSTQYFTMANWDASNPWQSAHPGGTFIVGFQTPSSFPGGLKKYMFNNYDIDGNNRVLALFFDADDLEPGLLIGVNSGASYELKWFGSPLAVSSKYVLFFTVAGDAKTWYMRVYDVGATAWLTDASGTISGTMNYTSGDDWTIGCRSDLEADTFWTGKIYFDQIYNTIMTPEEMTSFMGGGYTPPTGDFGIISTCLTKQGSTVCIEGDALLTIGDELKLKVVFDKPAYGKSSVANPNGQFAFPYPLDTGTITLKYCGGDGTNTWYFCAPIESGMYEYGNVALSAVGDLDRDLAVPSTNATITDESGTEIDSYDVPQTAVDPNYNVRIFSGAGVFFKRSE